MYFRINIIFVIATAKRASFQRRYKQIYMISYMNEYIWIKKLCGRIRFFIRNLTSTGFSHQILIQIFYYLQRLFTFAWQHWGAAIKSSYRKFTNLCYKCAYAYSNNNITHIKSVVVVFGSILHFKCHIYLRLYILIY